MKSEKPQMENLVTVIETLMIHHTSFASALQIVSDRVADTLAGLPPCFELLLGPSRCGKTELIKTIARRYPESRQNGRRTVPLLVVYIESGTNPKDLPIAVIQALGLPPPKDSMRVKSLRTFMLSQLALAGVRVIVFDEASHLVDVGTRTPARVASDWFKDLQTNAKEIGIVLSGLPRLKRLLDNNEQLRNRTHKPVKLMPYRWDQEDERISFAGCVAAFLAEFTARGFQLDMSMNLLVRQCYAASAGHVGLLARFFMELAKLDAPSSLSRELCQRACDRLNLPGNGAVGPFADDTIEDVDLMQVLISELDRYELTLESISPITQLAQAKARASMPTSRSLT